ncbi:MAG: SET domain-containing protein [Ginsengibacter sp.]
MQRISSWKNFSESAKKAIANLLKFFPQNNHTVYLSTMITKAALLNELVNHSYVILRPSQVAGIGVFALRPIPKGCRDMFSKPGPDDKWITLTNKEVYNLPAHARTLIENYCLFNANQYYVPEKGFKALDVSLFLNHSDMPNIISIEDGNYFETLRDISEGEELLIDYGTIVDEV